jgi:hypothetical protein
MSTAKLSQYNWQRGTVHYFSASGYYPQQMQGWFLLSEDGHKVYARKIRGRNCWQFASVDQIIEFDPYEKASKA